MREENIRIEAGGELRKKVENIKMISLSFVLPHYRSQMSSVGWKLGASVARKASDVLAKFC